MNLYSQTYNKRNDNNVNNARDEKVNLRDTFKCARPVIPSFFYSYDCGLMDLECRFSNTKRFESEVTLGDRTAFTSCCHKGKAILPPLNQYEYFKYFKTGNQERPDVPMQSEEQSTDILGKPLGFRENIGPL